jgi:hypothetical protein
VTLSAFLALLPALLGLVTIQGSGAQPALRRLVSQKQVILRVPVQPRLATPPIRWVERKKRKCVPIGDIRAAALSGPESVDFMLKDRGRVRAHLSEGCPALDFYAGFYLSTEDDRMCAGRDSIHSRMGGNCEIDRFRSLVPKIKR